MESVLLAVLREFEEAWCAQDVERLCKLFTHNCLFEDIPLAVSCSGLKEIRQFLSATFHVIPDFKMQLTRINVGPNFAATEWIQTGTGSADIGDMKIKRQPYSVKTASVIEFDSGKIKRVSDYWDLSPLLEEARQ